MKTQTWIAGSAAPCLASLQVKAWIPWKSGGALFNVAWGAPLRQGYRVMGKDGGETTLIMESGLVRAKWVLGFHPLDR